VNDEQLKEAIKLSGLSEFEWLKNARAIIADLQKQLNNKTKRVWNYEELEREAIDHE